MSGAGEPRSRDGGVTLIEALAVVAITAMAALIAFPRLQQVLATLAQHQSVAVVSAQLRTARAEALRRDASVAFDVGAGGRTYRIGAGPAVGLPPGVSLALQGATADGRGASRIVFSGDGSSSGGAVGVRSARLVTVVAVAPDSGAVAVERR